MESILDYCSCVETLEENYSKLLLKETLIKALPWIFLTKARIPDMNLVFDIDDTLYDLMKPFQSAHKKFFAQKTPADVTELFLKSRRCSDIILEQEKQGLIAPEDTFAKRIQMTYQDAGLSVSRNEAALFEQEYRLRQKEIALFPCMERVLNICQTAQIPIAILTNGNSRGQRKKISALKLER